MFKDSAPQKSRGSARSSTFASPPLQAAEDVAAAPAPLGPKESDGTPGSGETAPGVQLRPVPDDVAPLMAHWAEPADVSAARGGQVHDAARRGTTGAGGELPHAGQIQRAFGKHDISGVHAHTGAAAAEATAAMGARAFASGTDVAFAPGRADLHTAAHEAAHIVQQRGGVQLQGGVGQAGDAYERHADAVADAVVAGRSAEPLLDRHAASGARSSGAPATGVQRITEEDLKGRGARVAEMAKTAPTAGMNLWVATCADPPATIFLLGTNHYVQLSEMAHGRDVIAFLQSEQFSHVYTELPCTLPGVTPSPTLVKDLEEKARLKRDLDARFPGGAPDLKTDRAGHLAHRQASKALDTAEGKLGGMDLKLDDGYAKLATYRGRDRKDPAPVLSNLETTDTRTEASEQNIKDLKIDTSDDESRKKHARGADEQISPNDDVRAGDQQLVFGEVAKELLAGRDILNGEERNRQWVDRLKLPGNLQAGDRQLWIVGAAHLPGLILRFQDLGWTVGHRGPLPVADKGGDEPTTTAGTGGGGTSFDSVD